MAMRDQPETSAVLFYTERYSQFDYGFHHPLKMRRIKLVFDLLTAYSVTNHPRIEVREPQPAPEDDLRMFHEETYLAVLKGLDAGIHPSNPYRYGLGPGDNPIFPGLYELSTLIAGSSLEAAEAIVEKKTPVAFSIAGGLHHALPDRASGFCYINDAVVAIQRLVRRGARVAYIDVDAHHGDGVQMAFYSTDQVLTISLHEDGHFLFPGTGFVEEIGSGPGRGYSVNVPLYPGTDDQTYLWAFDEVVPPLLARYRPDILVTQLGVDSFASDPLTHLRLTTHGFTQVVERFRALGLPWIALGGGGYDLSNVARGWTLAFGIMSGIELADEIPDAGRARLREEGIAADRLHDPSPSTSTDRRVREQAERAVQFIHREILAPMSSPSS
jgi:acetoin utilization protein AcuC